MFAIYPLHSQNTFQSTMYSINSQIKLHVKLFFRKIKNKIQVQEHILIKKLHA